MKPMPVLDPDKTLYSHALIDEQANKAVIRAVLVEAVDAVMKRWTEGTDVVIYVRRPTDVERARWAELEALEQTP